MIKKQIAAFTVAVLALTVSAQEKKTVASDGFSSGVLSSSWRADTSVIPSVADDTSGLGQGNALFANVSGSSVNVLLFKFEPVVLAEAGDWIEAEFLFRMDGAFTADQYTPVIGLYDDSGTPQSSDDKGYAVMMSSVSKSPRWGIGKDTGSSQGLLAGTDLYNLYSSNSGTLLSSGSNYSMKLLLTRNESGAVRVDYTLAGEAQYTASATDTLSPYFKFGEFGIRCRYNNYVIDEIRITKKAGRQIRLVVFSSN